MPPTASVRRTHRAVVGLVAAAALLAGCSSTGGVTTSADKAKSSASSKVSQAASKAVASKPAAKASKKTAAKQTAQLKDPITLKGNDGVKVSVTPLKLVSSAKGTDEFNTPDKGKKFVAVQFRLKNVGTKAYDDSPSNGAKVIDDEGQQFDTDIFSETTAGPNLPASTKLTADNTALGYLVFQIPKASKAVRVQFSMDSGFGDAGEWLLH